MREIRQLPALGLLALISLAVLAACGEIAGLRAGQPAVTPASTPTPSGVYFDGAISVELLAPESLSQGEVLQLDVLMTNHGEEPFRFVHGPQMGLTVVGEQGEVFRHPTPPPSRAYAEDPDSLPFELASGESVELDSLWGMPARMFSHGNASWDLRGEDLLSMAPGVYELHTAIALLKEGTRHAAVLEMPVLTLVVEESALGKLAAGVELELIAPATVTASQPAPLDMHITNANDEPVTLRFGDAAIAGRLEHRRHYLDVLVLGAEGILWSGLRAEGINTGRAVSFLTLAPGESRTLSGLFRRFSETPWEVHPWEWDQHDESGQLVPPGPYAVRGIASVADPDGRGYVTVATPPHELVITR